MKTAIFLALTLFRGLHASSLLITPSANPISLNPGIVTSFSADLTNLSGSIIDLGSAQVTASGPFSIDLIPFLFGAASIAPNQSTGAFEIFSVLPDANASLGRYSGDLTITDLQGTIIGSTSIAFQVVPEPASGPVDASVLLCIALITIGTQQRRKATLPQNVKAV